jgi:8-oxo-dGTP pyrophosphatase MutT (NUDIX family)
MKNNIIKVNMKVSTIFQPPFSRDGEVLPVIILPNNKILLHTKSFYPKNAYRLPTGGIEGNETPEEALIREIKEETNLDLKEKTLLAKIIYNIEYPNGKKTFTTYIFLVKAKNRNYKVVDKNERTSHFKEIKIEDLPKISEKLRNLKKGPKNKLYDIKKWDDWGRFRAIPHEIIYGLLSEKDERRKAKSSG